MPADQTTPADPKPGDPVPCADCGEPTPFEPPYDPREQLCDECHRNIQEMKERGEWLR